MSSVWTIVISAATGGVFTLITTYVSAIITSKRERKKWESETAIKFIDYSLSNPELAKKVARQFAIAVLVHIDSDNLTTIKKYFLPAFCRFTIGRHEDHDICIHDSLVSRDHGLFYYRNGKIYYNDTLPTNRTVINGKLLQKKRCLRSGDLLIFGETKIRFEEL